MVIETERGNKYFPDVDMKKDKYVQKVLSPYWKTGLSITIERETAI